VVQKSLKIWILLVLVTDIIPKGYVFLDVEKDVAFWDNVNIFIEMSFSCVFVIS